LSTVRRARRENAHGCLIDVSVRESGAAEHLLQYFVGGQLTEGPLRTDVANILGQENKGDLALVLERT